MSRSIKWTDIRIAERLGEGHSGEVYRAVLERDVGTHPVGKVLAVKRYKPWVLHEPGQIERILREIQIGRSICHRNLVQVLGAVTDNDGRPCIVMSFCEGPTLEAVLQQARARNVLLDAEYALATIRDIASGLNELHARAVIHRDVKPANVIATSEGAVLADLGVVRSKDFVQQTTTGSFFGTIRYAAPEYLFGEDYDESIDIYSLGAIALEMFTGREPFEDHRHWARVVGERVRLNEDRDEPDLTSFAHQSGWAVALFARRIIDASRRTSDLRTLSLGNIVYAVNERLWTDSYTYTKGQFQRGSIRYSSPYDSADKAAATLSKALEPSEMLRLQDLLSKYFWRKYIIGEDLTSARHTWLAGLKVIQSTGQHSKLLRINPAVLEAFARGLLRPAST